MPKFFQYFSRLQYMFYVLVGYGTLALAFGFLFELKQMFEKKRLFQQQNI